MILYPNAYFNKVEDITIEFLQKNSIKALMLDVDNTLVDRSKVLSDNIITWVKQLRGQGVKLYILSNTNDIDKIKKISNELNIPYHSFAMKPLKRGFIKVQKKLGEKPENIAIVGDQIFTDIIGGNRCKMFTILVDPIKEQEFWYTAWKRPIEKKIKKNIAKGVFPDI